ncbi:MAG TPA: hypothetical protein VFC19_01145 [Candidatus Limnocylindrales bacterium]|nr:hypothetical protein [Candidatus Limnocylindrales bacterium]
MAKLICPYCFASVERKSLLFRCPGTGPGRAPGCNPPPMFPADGRKSRAVHKDCGKTSLIRACPNCQHELAADYCDVPSRLVALVGAKESGKSTYICVLIHELMNRVGEEFRFSLKACDDRTGRRYQRDFEQYLYNDHQVIPVTQSAGTEPHDPLVYLLTVQKRRWGRKALTLVFFDTAGEDLSSSDSVDKHLRYLGASDAIVFLVDPLALSGAAADVAPAARANRTGPLPDDPREVIGRITNLLRAAENIPAPKRLRQAVALAVTKVDALRAIVAEHSPMHRAREYAGHLDLTDRGLVDEQVRALLTRWNAGALDRLLGDAYRAHNLFGLSALGHIPSGGDLGRFGISPVRVEDPLLWLLHRFGMIRASRGSPSKG